MQNIIRTNFISDISKIFKILKYSITVFVCSTSLSYAATIAVGPNNTNSPVLTNSADDNYNLNGPDAVLSTGTETGINNIVSNGTGNIINSNGLEANNISVQSGDLTINGSDFYSQITGTSSSSNLNINTSYLTGNLGTNNGEITIGSSSTFESQSGSLNGKFNIGVNNSSNTIVNSRITLSSSGLNSGINSGTTFNFKFANKQKSSSNQEILFLKNNSGTYNQNIFNNFTVTDDSELMIVTTKLGQNDGEILAVYSVDPATLNKLSGSDAKALTIIDSINAPSGSNMDLLKTQLQSIKSGDTAALQKAVDSTRVVRNNATSNASVSLTDRSNNIIESHNNSVTDSILGFSSGNNNMKISGAGAWGQVFTGKAEQDTRQGQEGYDSNTTGVVLGGDATLKGDNDINYVLGAAVTYANANISTDSNNKSNVDSYQLALYNNNIGSNGLGLYNNNIINLAYNKYKNSRNINVGTFNAIANADYSGVQYGAKTGLGYNIKLSDKLMISPNASIRYSALDQQNYTETGAGNAGLIVRNDRFETLVSDLGVRAISKFDVNQHNVVPALNLSWSHNLMTDGQSSTSHYIAGGDPLANNSATLVKDIFNIGVEAGIFAKDKASSFTVRVDTQKGKEYIGYMGSLKYRYEF